MGTGGGRGLAKDHTASQWQGWDEVPAPPSSQPGALSLPDTRPPHSAKSQLNRKDLKVAVLDLM